MVARIVVITFIGFPFQVTEKLKQMKPHSLLTLVILELIYGSMSWARDPLNHRGMYYCRAV